jgi:hypothetical protein
MDYFLNLKFYRYSIFFKCSSKKFFIYRFMPLLLSHAIFTCQAPFYVYYFSALRYICQRPIPTNG